MLKSVYYYSGAAFIVGKFQRRKPEDTIEPSGFLWVVGLYVSIFGIASGLHQADRSAAAKSAIPSQRYSVSPCASYRYYNDALLNIRLKPRFFHPLSVVESFFGVTAPQAPEHDPVVKEIEKRAYRFLTLGDPYPNETTEETRRNIEIMFQLFHFGTLSSQREGTSFYETCTEELVVEQPTSAAEHRIRTSCVRAVFAAGCRDTLKSWGYPWHSW